MINNKKSVFSDSVSAKTSGSGSASGLISSVFVNNVDVNVTAETIIKYETKINNENIGDLENKLLMDTTKAAISTSQDLVNKEVRSLLSKSIKYLNDKENKKINTILIVLDELVAWHNLPESFTSTLPGYNKFKKRSVEFTNIHNNRQMCSASRSTMLSGIVNTGIQDNIDQTYQNKYVPQLNPEFNTIGKVLKKNGFDITAYYGKSHIDANLSSNYKSTPRFNTNTIYSARKYGFDLYSTFGDHYYYQNHGYFGDQITQEFIVKNLNNQVDYVSTTGEKYIGIIPFLKARHEDNKSFHLQCHYLNPHDTMQCYQNLSQKPYKDQSQFKIPFLYEQTTGQNIANPYDFDNTFTNAYIQNSNMVKNYFESTFSEYSNNDLSLPFLNSYKYDYATSSVTNSPFGFYTGLAESYKLLFTYPNNSEDISSWKNLVNNYYCLIYEIDNYISEIYDFLEEHNMFKNTAVIITADHGDQMSSHGLKQKGYPFKESVNVPFMVYSPQLSPGRSNILGSLIDIVPTIETLANVVNKSMDFKGVSLLNLSNNVLSVRQENIPVFNLYNSYMTYTSYFAYKVWYAGQSNDVQKLSSYSYADNYFEYFGHYSMCINYINGVQYKLARFNSIREVIAYNFVYNKLLTDIFNVSFILNNIPQEVENLINSNILNDFKNLLSSFGSETFSFSQMFDFIKNNTSREGDNSDSVFLSLFVGSIINYLKKDNYSLLIAGSETNFNELYKDPHYYYFLYNMSEDTSEIINLLDKNFPERQTSNTLDIANQMNSELNSIIPQYADPNGFYIYLLPVAALVVATIKGILTFGKDYPKYEVKQTIDMITMFNTNSYDADFENTSV